MSGCRWRNIAAMIAGPGALSAVPVSVTTGTVFSKNPLWIEAITS
jgi:hypothetical protein